MSGERNAGNDTCRALARALDVPEIEVFRRAGLMSSLPASVENDDEALFLFRRLSSDLRPVALDILRTLSNGAARHIQPAAVYEVNATYSPPNSPWPVENAPTPTGQVQAVKPAPGGALAPEIEQTFYLLPKPFQDIVTDQINKLARLANAETLAKIAHEADLMGAQNRVDTNAQSGQLDAGIPPPAPGNGEIDR
jgi:hypothetical protein